MQEKLKQLHMLHMSAKLLTDDSEYAVLRMLADLVDQRVRDYVPR